MSKEVPEVPPEVKFEIGLSSMWSMMIALEAMIVENFAGVSLGVPWEKYLATFKPFVDAFVAPGTKTLIENFKIPGNDCTTAAKAHHISVDAMGFKPELIEMTPNKAVAHEKRCWYTELCPSIFPKYLDIPIEKMACTIFDEAVGTTVNPKITFRHGETICKGGKVCEHIWELKE